MGGKREPQNSKRKHTLLWQCDELPGKENTRCCGNATNYMGKREPQTRKRKHTLLWQCDELHGKTRAPNQQKKTHAAVAMRRITWESVSPKPAKENTRCCGNATNYMGKRKPQTSKRKHTLLWQCDELHGK